MIEKDDMLRFEGSIWCNLDIALRHTDQIFREKAQCLGLTVIEWYILRALFETDGQNASQLAESVGRAATSFTPNLDKLQAKGYITRIPDPSDRRAIHIFVTDKAKQEKQKIINHAAELDAYYQSMFTGDELACFERILGKLQAVEM